MDPVVRGVLLGAGLTLFTSIVTAYVGHIFAKSRESEAEKRSVKRELRAEERRVKERFREKYKLVTRTAYYLTEDIKAYKIKPHRLNTMVDSFMRLQDAFIEFSEGLASDYLENLLDENTYTAFNEFTAVLVVQIDTISKAIRSNLPYDLKSMIIKLPLGKLKEFTNRIDESIEKGGDE